MCGVQEKLLVGRMSCRHALRVVRSDGKLLFSPLKNFSSFSGRAQHNYRQRLLCNRAFRQTYLRHRLTAYRFPNILKQWNVRSGSSRFYAQNRLVVTFRTLWGAFSRRSIIHWANVSTAFVLTFFSYRHDQVYYGSRPLFLDMRITNNGPEHNLL